MRAVFGQALVGLGHLGGGIADRLVRLADRLLDLAEPGLQTLQRRMNRGLLVPANTVTAGIPRDAAIC